MKTVCLIQARLGSERLPNKVLADINGHPMLWHVVNRARKIVGVDQVVVITSFSEADRRLVEYCDREGIPVLRGGSSESDVLGRYYDCATKLGADVIVRVTADCPMLDPEIASLVLAPVISGTYEYNTDTMPPTFPDGLDVEAFTMSLLEKADATAELPSEREHVTPWMREHAHGGDLGNVIDLSAMRWTVDTTDDLEFVQAVFKELGDDFNMDDVLKLLERKPELAEINAGHTRNEGLEVSKKRDKKK